MSSRKFSFANAAVACATLAALAAGLACGGAEPAPPQADPETHRSPPAGEVVGTAGNYGSHVWRGIPYAEAPVGELRWRAPRVAARWEGLRQALDFGSICPQRASRLGGETSVEPGTLVGEEDCLTLNVWAPPFAEDAVPTGERRLPVMVWLHGGGNVVGSGRFYDGGNLATSHDLVVVSINYRLGPLGWFRHASLRGPGTSPADRSGNYGTLDIIRSLEWVRDNIAAFGGDPGNVTIFGESAGARNVLSLLVSPLARGLFHRAIAQSGGTNTLAPYQAENLADADDAGHRNSSREVLLRLLIDDGGADDRADALARLGTMSVAEVGSYLRGKDSFELLAAYRNDAVEDLPEVPQLFRDGAVLPGREIPELLASTSGHHGVPVMLGTNRDENKLFLAFDPDHVDWWLGLLPRVRDEQRFELTAEYLSAMWKATAADELAAALRESGTGSVFVYRFDWDEEPTILFLVDVASLVGAAHGLEIPFVFGHWNLGPSSDWLFDGGNQEGRDRLSRQVMSYWAEFAYAGNPGRGRGGELPEWTAWDDASPNSERFLVLDTPGDGGLRMASERVTSAQVLAAVENDPRLADARERCGIYLALARFGRGFDESRYPQVAGGACTAYPIAAYPWEGHPPPVAARD